MDQKTLLITGGAWYIGSHAVVAFEQAGYKTVILDNFLNSSNDNLIGIQKILGYSPDFYECDIWDQNELNKIFREYHFDGVVHFAGLKAVGESCQKPHLYHQNNIWGSLVLFGIMEQFGVKKIIFSSSATVYSSNNISPLTENMPLATTNPYGTTKLVLEKVLEDYAKQWDWSVTNLRYFNPIWAHPSWYIGEIPRGTPNNLLPFIMDVACGKREKVIVFGDDYPTSDGTGVRDYIDVCDLVDAHLQAYQALSQGLRVYNIGTGSGTSVLEMICIVSDITGKQIPYEISERRPGDIATVFCDPFLAQKELGFKAKVSICESIEKSWNFSRILK